MVSLKCTAKKIKTWAHKSFREYQNQANNKITEINFKI